MVLLVLTFALSFFDRALRFQAGNFGTCEKCVRLGDKLSISIGEEEVQNGHSFSFEAWIKVTEFTDGWVFMHAGPCSHNQCAFLGFQRDGAAVFGLIINDLIVPGFAADLDQWVNWAGTYDSMTLERKLYRNGRLVGSDKAKQPGYTPHSTNFYLGMDNWGNHPFVGDLAELRIWDKKILTQREVRELMCTYDPYSHETSSNLALSLGLSHIDRDRTTELPLAEGFILAFKEEIRVVEGPSFTICDSPNNDQVPAEELEQHSEFVGDEGDEEEDGDHDDIWAEKQGEGQGYNYEADENLNLDDSSAESHEDNQDEVQDNHHEIFPDARSQEEMNAPDNNDDDGTRSQNNSDLAEPEDMELDEVDLCHDRDCSGICRTEKWLSARRGDGNCNEELNCEHFDFDSGDCEAVRDGLQHSGLLLWMIFGSLLFAAWVFFGRNSSRRSPLPLFPGKHGWEA